MFQIKHLIYCAFLFLLGSNAYAQESNYWNLNFGASSSLKGGIEIAGVRNVAAIYYNPGALAFTKGDNLEAQADLFSLDVLNIENAAGEGVNLNLLEVNIAPSIVGYLMKSKKDPRLSFAFSAMSKFNSKYVYVLEYEAEGNYLLPDENVEVFQGKLDFENRIKENWLTAALAYQLNDIVGVGLATNLFIRVQDYSNIYTAFAVPKNEINSPLPNFSKITSTNDILRLNFRDLGFIFKPGVNINLEALKLGLTFTMPSISLGFLNNTSSKSQNSIVPDEDEQIYYEANSHSKYSGNYNTPFSIALGAEYAARKFKVAIAAEWFAKIDRFNMIERNDKSIDLKNPTSDNPDYAIPVMANKNIINAGISIEYHFKESLSYIGSVRTDFNYFDDSKLNRNSDFVPFMTYWDIYHVTSGIALHARQLDLILGINYGYGRSENDEQFVNMTTASQSNYLRGDVNTNTSTRSHNLSFTLGFNFDFGQQKEPGTAEK